MLFYYRLKKCVPVRKPIVMFTYIVTYYNIIAGINNDYCYNLYDGSARSQTVNIIIYVLHRHQTSGYIYIYNIEATYLNNIIYIG